MGGGLIRPQDSQQTRAQEPVLHGGKRLGKPGIHTGTEH
jgi:hypothetical protein